jgi:F-box protein 9
LHQLTVKQGLFIGNWELHGTTVYLTSLTDPSGHALRYVFQMTLQLRSKPIGRWNRLEFMAYDSVDLETGEAVPVSLKHETTPFLFSKVKSYHS